MKTTTWMATACVLTLTVTAAASTVETTAATDAQTVQSAPPARPVPLTANQINALQELSRQAPHASAADTRAAYTPEAAREMRLKLKDVSAGGWYATYLSTVLFILISAAPL